jgi:exopolyphosphatase / guanosine-5'-triphosphate,3'-diphosphate pyrophosphatase
MKYFSRGEFTPQAFERAGVAAKAVLEEALDVYRRDAWDVAYGSSGTIGAVGDALAASGWPAGSVTRAGLDWLLDRLIKVQSADRLKLDGIKDDRRPVIGGGVSVLLSVFDLLGIDEMKAAQGALRHGVLYDMLDRERADTDLRAVSVDRIATKFGTDAVQGARVARVAAVLLQQVQAAVPAEPAERMERKVTWAARLHEIGSRISHSDYHKHGAYILDNADAPGFAQHELHRLSLLVLGHRGKLRKLDADFNDDLFVQQLLSLRLAVILCHARRDPDLKGMKLSMDPGDAPAFRLMLRPGWSDAFPQSAWLLREEALAWEKVGRQLVIAGPSDASGGGPGMH